MNSKFKEKMEQLKSIVKRSNKLKYSIGMLILFLMTGGGVEAEENILNNENNEVVKTLNEPIKKLQLNLKSIRDRNDDNIKNTRLKLIQLIEQGNQVVKSPWSSWQFGANYYYSSMNGTYNGRDDKTPNIGIIERNTDIFSNSVSKSSKKYNELNIKKTENPYKLISVKEVKPPVKDFKFSPVFSLREATEIAPVTIDVDVPSPDIPNAFTFTTSSPNIPTVNPVEVNIETVELTSYANDWNMGIIGRKDTNYQRSLFVIAEGEEYTLNSNSKSLNNRTAAPVIIDMSITGQDVKVEKGATLNINKVGGRAVSIDINPGYVDWKGYPETSSTFLNEGTINLNATNTAAIELQTETTREPYTSNTAPASTGGLWIAKKEIYGINSGNINGNDNRQVAMTFVREQAPGVEQQFLRNAENGTITMNGNKSMGFSFNVSDLYAEAHNDGKIILNGTNSYGFAFGKRIGNNRLKEGSVIRNNQTGIIEINGDKSGGIALEEMIRSKNNPYDRNIDITNEGKININSKESFGIYSEQLGVINYGEININENAVASIGLYSTKKNTVTTELSNYGTINIRSNNSKNIGLFTDNAKVINDKDGIVNVSNGENIGAFISGTGVGENHGNISSGGDGSIAVLTKDSGKFINTREIMVNAKTSSTNNGAIGILANTGSTFSGEDGILSFNISGENSVGIYSKGTVKIGESDIIATNNAINFFVDTDGLIELEAGKTAKTTTKNGALLFFNGDSNGRIKLSGNLKSIIEGRDTADTRGTVFSYSSSSVPVGGSISGYNDSLSYGTFTLNEVQHFFDNTFGTGALGSSTLNNLELTMKKNSRLFISPNVKAKLSTLVTNDLLSGISGAPTISSDSSNEYSRNLLLKSELEIDQPVNLDLASETYNNLELSNSSIINNNRINGTKANQYAMVQENNENNKGYVTLLNNLDKEIILNGGDSLAIYAKNGYILNKGSIELGGDNSTAIYGVDKTSIQNENSSKIKINGDNSIGIYYSNTNTTDIGENLENNGEIELNGNKDIGIAYTSNTISASNPDLVKNFADIKINGNNSIGIYSKVLTNNPYVIENEGNITISSQNSDKNNPSIGIYNKDNLSKIINKNNGNIKVSKNNIGILGASIENQGNIELDTAGIGIYSNGGNVDLQSGNIVLKNGQEKNETIGILLNGKNQSLI